MQLLRYSLSAVFLLSAAALRAQGPLTPPGPPGETGRSLDQIEPRIPIPGGGATYNISQPGSYVLTGNITVSGGHGIFIGADNVSIDLGGFTIASTAENPNGFGVSLGSNRSHIAISNGHIRGGTVFSAGSYSGGGFDSGIDYSGSPKNVRVTGVSVSAVADYGMDLGPDNSSSISGCTVRTASIYGMRAGSVSDSAALEIGGTGILAGTVQNCIATVTSGSNTIISTAPTLAGVSAQIAALQVSAPTDTRVKIPGGTVVYSITQPGSYLLTGNMTMSTGDAIFISSDNVTLDLNGFNLTNTAGVPGASAGVSTSGNRQNIIIRNGTIRGGTSYGSGAYSGTGFHYGISIGSGSKNVAVENIAVSGVKRGIELNNGLTDYSLVARNCTVNIAEFAGIRASSVFHSTVSTCGGVAISAPAVFGSTGESTGSVGITSSLAQDSYGITSAASAGVSAIDATVATNCRGVNTGAGTGLSGGTVTNSRGEANTGLGLSANQSATNCFGTSTSGPGLSASLATNCTGAASGGNAAITATIGVTCRAVGGILSIGTRYLMP